MLIQSPLYTKSSSFLSHPELMKVQCVYPGGLDHLKIEDRPIPSPKSGEVLVRWHATSLNYHDYLVAIGAIPVQPGRIPMSDGAGEIIEIGDDVHDWKPGDKVMSMFFPGWIEGAPTFRKIVGVSGETIDGYMCEMSCVPAYGLTRMPVDYSYGSAATLPCAGLTAWNALMHTGQLRAGEKVLVQGTGGMSMLAFAFAKAAGARIFCTTSSDEKAERLLAMGAEEVVNYKEDDRWGKSLFSIGGDGMDLILDVGGGSTMRQSIEAVKIGGRIISIGILGDGRKGEITFPKLFFKFIELRGIAVGSRVMQEAMIDAIETNDIQPIIDRSFSFDALKEAFSYQDSGSHVGKIVVTID